MILRKGVPLLHKVGQGVELPKKLVRIFDDDSTATKDFPCGFILDDRNGVVNHIRNRADEQWTIFVAAANHPVAERLRFG